MSFIASLLTQNFVHEGMSTNARLRVLARRKKLKKFLVAGALTTFAACLAALFMTVLLRSESIDFSSGFGKNRIIAVISVTVVLVALSMAVLAYLRPSTTGTYGTWSREDIERMRRYQDRIKRSFSTADPSVELSEEERKAITSAIIEKISSRLPQEHLEEIRGSVRLELRDEAFALQFQNTQGRITREIQDLARRANLNLVLGMLTTVLGVSVLGFAVLSTPSTKDLTELFAYFVPRLSLVIIIEIFAYFFLQLYKQSLDGIKYFQNELTNIESKYLALTLARQTDDLPMCTGIANALCDVERNNLSASMPKSSSATTVDVNALYSFLQRITDSKK